MKLIPVMCVCGSTVFTAVCTCTVPIYRNSCMHSPDDGHLNECLLGFAILNSAVTNILLNIFWACASFLESLDIRMSRPHLYQYC